MKIRKIITTVALLLGAYSAFSQSSQFIVKGKIGKANNGKYVKLYYQRDTTKVVDSVLVTGATFVLRGQLTDPTLGHLSMDNIESGDRIDLFLAAGTVHVETKDSLSYARIYGTALTEAHEKLAQKLRPADRKVIDGFVRFKNMPEGDEKKAYVTELLAGLDQYTRFKRETIHQFVEENPGSYVSLYHLDRVAGGNVNYETTYPYYDKLSTEVKNSALGKQLGDRLSAAKGVLTGQLYKDFVSTTPEGQELSLKEVIVKNKYTLLDFWASWCGPCRKENPHVVDTYEAFKKQGFTVLSVSLDDDKTRWTEAISKDGMPWYHVSSLKGWKEPAAALYGVRAIPQNVLIDSQGKIVATNLRGETLFNKVQSLLK
ncbi:MAG: AhpC/TSA family protein [Sphingobacterium sp.]|jgi:thiol-disulfide isomerase/thioredoxin|nr:AhpC/TSA family protein [Sphingobacterium sp.]